MSGAGNAPGTSDVGDGPGVDGAEDATGPTEPEDATVGRPLRRRIADNPRPAAIWGSVALVLVLLEVPLFVGGVLLFVTAGGFTFSMVAAVPRWIGANVESALGFVAGSIAHDAAALVLLGVFALVLTSFVLPGRLVDRLPVEFGRTRSRHLEVVLVTAVLATVAFLLAYTPVGGFLDRELSLWLNVLQSITEVPSITSRELIPNLGHRLPEGGWEGTFLGLSPRLAWLVRFGLVWVYAFACFGWAWKGYNVYRDHYREADWTPRDDTIRRFRNHSWGQFGLFVVFGFVVLAVFAPAIGAVSFQHNIAQPFNYEFEHLNEDGEVETILHGQANIHTNSDGQNTVPINSYDQYDRYAPLGTTPSGQDMMTHIAYGARTSLIIALTAVALGGFIAITLSLMTAYYKGLLDVIVVFTSDTIISIPVIVLALILVVVFQQSNHPLAQPMDGGLLLALILGFAYWPGMWRSIRGPSLQVAEQEWVDAAKSYGQKPSAIMRKHMAPYVASYIIIYASLLIGGVIITVAALSFLGLGINPPTPEWGRLISEGRGFIWSSSWHVATITGLLISLVVIAFNALGDAVRDAIDPEADVGEGAATGGGGA